MKIGLFGGSFDPIHKGHVKIAQLALKQLQLDEVQLIPTRHNPWKKHTGASVEDRINMMNLVLIEEKHISINRIEIDMYNNDKNFTIDTLVQLTQKNPDVEYYYIMGMDQALSFHKWKNAEKISHMVQLVAFQRSGYDLINENIEKYHFILLDNQPIHASSSEVREGQLHMLDQSVLRYITSHGLYLETMVKPYMKEKRWLHTCSVAKLASEIAQSNGLDAKKAYIAGMLHDIAKEMEETKARQLMLKVFPQYLEKPIAIWHQWLSAYVAHHEFLVNDEVVLQAIADHTTASISISQIGKCVYVADKLDPLRDYDSSLQIELCKRDIDEGFRQELIHFYEYSKKQNRDIDECFYEIYNHFIGKGEK